MHIGGSDAGVKIGGIDNPVIKNPVTKLPYIPGSSLKGKIRSLLEAYYGLETIKTDNRTHQTIKTGEPSKLDTRPQVEPDWSGDNNQIAVLFGSLPNNATTADIYPTRLIFRDSKILGAFEGIGADAFNDDLGKLVDKMGSQFVEGKFEVAINRIKGTAMDGALRQIERVPAGTVFDFEIVIRQFTDKDQQTKDEGGYNHLNILKKGLKLLQNDALGGYGSRGSGRIKLYDLRLGDEALDLDSVTL